MASKASSASEWILIAKGSICSVSAKASIKLSWSRDLGSPATRYVVLSKCMPFDSSEVERDDSAARLAQGFVMRFGLEYLLELFNWSVYCSGQEKPWRRKFLILGNVIYPLVTHTMTVL